MTTIFDNGGVRVESVPICYLCGRVGNVFDTNLRDLLIGTPGVWNFRQCTSCELVWLDPRPVAADLTKLYADYVTTHTMVPASRGCGLLPPAAIERSILAAAFGYKDADSQGMGQAAGRILSHFDLLREFVGATVAWLEAPLRGSLLDVGCGNGQLLAQMQKFGWEVAGLEPDPVAVETARSTYGLNVTCGKLEDAGFPNDTFDAVTMIHVIEHVLDPISTLRECHRVVRKGGRLVVVTPNIKSLGLRWFGSAWLGLDPPRHIFLFSPWPLRHCAESAGLRILELKTIARWARFIWHSGQALRRDRQLSLASLAPLPWRLRVEGVLFWVGEHLMTKIGPWGEEILLTATKET